VRVAFNGHDSVGFSTTRCALARFGAALDRKREPLATSSHVGFVGFHRYLQAAIGVTQHFQIVRGIAVWAVQRCSDESLRGSIPMVLYVVNHAARCGVDLAFSWNDEVFLRPARCAHPPAFGGAQAAIVTATKDIVWERSPSLLDHLRKSDDDPIRNIARREAVSRLKPADGSQRYCPCRSVQGATMIDARLEVIKMHGRSLRSGQRINVKLRKSSEARFSSASTFC